MTEDTPIAESATESSAAAPPEAPPPAAEQIGTLTRELAAAHENLKQAREALDKSETRRALDAALVKAGAIDTEVAGALIEKSQAEIAQRPNAQRPNAPKPRTTDLIAALKKSKPYLFKRAEYVESADQFRSAAAAPMSGGNGESGSSITTLAREARDTGDRRVLLRYLRARRTA